MSSACVANFLGTCVSQDYICPTSCPMERYDMPSLVAPRAAPATFCLTHVQRNLQYINTTSNCHGVLTVFEMCRFRRSHPSSLRGPLRAQQARHCSLQTQAETLHMTPSAQILAWPWISHCHPIDAVEAFLPMCHGYCFIVMACPRSSQGADPSTVRFSCI